MKTINYILGSLALVMSLGTTAQELVPDQNPNYMISAEKYAEKSDELTANQGETIQETYKAYDWREAKEEAKQQRIDRRYELRKLRIQSRTTRRGFYNNRGYNNNRGYYNNGYNNGYGYNNSCNYNNNNSYPNLNNALYGAGLGLGLYYLLH